MKTNLYNYFYYTRIERNGALLLCLLCIAGLSISTLLKKKHIEPEPQQYKVQFASLSYSEASFSAYNNTETTELFEFNPNHASKEAFIKLGLTPKLAQTIINYRNKGGYFRRSEDLQKIYGMTPDLYTKLEPYIEMEEAKDKMRFKFERYDRKPAALFFFDPNKATQNDFVQLGLSEKTAGTIINYRNKGGIFRKKEDLKKIYGLKDKDYERLLPFVTLESALPVSQQQKPITQATEAPKSPDYKVQFAKTVSIDINRANAEDWQTLRGIGAAYARKIVNYREKLGGFSTIEQIGETYGLPDSTFEQIKPYLKQSPVFRKISLNTATLDELKAHPYIDNKQAAALINYRVQHGKFQSLDDLLQLKVITVTWLDKMKPYLELS